MALLFENNAFGKLQSGITAIQTSITLQALDGAKFPSPTGGDYFYATLVDSTATREIVKCTARTGDVLTVVRAQDDTVGSAFSAGDVVELRVTAAVMEDLQSQITTNAASIVTNAGNLTTHAALTGSAAHGLGTISTQNANAVAITGGTVSGISGSITIDNESADVSIKARDHDTGSTPEVANIIFGTGSPPTASTVPHGTLFIKYTA